MRFLTRALFALVMAVAPAVVVAELALVTASSSAIDAISFEEAQLLYLGRLSALRDRTTVQLLDLPPGDTRDAFYQQLTGRNPVQIRAYWSRMVFTGRARPPQQVDGESAMIMTLQANLNAIGYLPLMSVPADVRVLFILP